MKIGSFVKGSVILVVSNLCMKAISFFLLPLYTIHLDTAMLGVSDLITSFTSFLFTLFVLGLDSAFSAFYYEDTYHNQKQKVLSTIVFVLSSMAILPLILSFFGYDISQILFGTSEYGVVVIIALCSVSFHLCFIPYALLIRMENRMIVFGGVNFFASLSMILLNVLFVVYLNLGAMSLVLSTTIVNLLQLFLYIKISKAKIKRKNFDYGLLKNMMKYALPIIPNALMMVVLSLSDRYILQYFHGANAVGIYGVASRFALMINIFVAESYYSANEILQNLLYGQAIFGITSIVSYGIYFEKKSVFGLIATSMGAIVNLILNFIFIPKYGINAAALTTLIGYLITFVFSYFFAQKLYKCNYDLLKNIVVVLITYFVAYIVQNIYLPFKVIIWIVIVCFILFSYKDLLLEIINTIKTRKKKITN